MKKERGIRRSLLQRCATCGGIAQYRASTVPVIVKLANVPSSLPHGAKGVGESPTMGVPPATLRAVEKIVGIRLRETPISIEKITL
jgi:CO/xanthine dehydrogenase Mo-binding subunit